MANDNRNGGIFTSAGLHIIAMILMLCDHMWATLFLRAEWLTCIGRIAFPIFAFLNVEGFFHTHDRKAYVKRLLLFAVLSEIPFNYLMVSSPIYPFHQNVLFTFLIGILCMSGLEKVKEKFSDRLYFMLPLMALITFGGYLLGTVTFVDYYGYGILTILIFYFFRGRKWWCYLGQFAGMVWVHQILFRGYYYPIVLFDHEFELKQQAFAVLSLLFIWLYNGKQGHHSKAFRLFCYAFYPVHMMLLLLIWGVFFA